MNIIYTNKDKGIVVSILGGIVVGIYITIGIIIILLEQTLPFFKEIMEQISFVVAGQQIVFFDLFWVLLILYIYEVVDGFLDGILMNSIKIIVILLIYSFLLHAGNFIILFSMQMVHFRIYINLTFILSIILGVYIFVLLCEVLIIEVKAHPFKNLFLKKRNKKQEESGGRDSRWRRIRKKLKRNYKWIDFKDDYIHLGEGETLLVEDWKTVKYKNKKSTVRFFIIDSLILFFFGFLYGIISYYVYDVPSGSEYYNNFFLGLFFPTWALLFTGFISIRHYLRAFIWIYGVITIQILLRAQGLITVEGFFLFSIIIQIMSMFLFNVSSEINQLSTPEITGILYSIIGLILIIEFLFLLLNLGIKKLRGKISEIDILLSNKHIYVRKRRNYNDWRILFIFLGLMFFPYNPSSYNDIYQKMIYKKESIVESWYYDYGKISYDKTIFKLKKYKKNKFVIMSEIVCLLVFIILIGITTIQYLFGIIIIILGMRELWKLKKKVDVTNIKIRYFRHRAKGSYFKLNTADILILYQLPSELVNSFLEVKPKFSWMRTKIGLNKSITLRRDNKDS